MSMDDNDHQVIRLQVTIFKNIYKTISTQWNKTSRKTVTTETSIGKGGWYEVEQTPELALAAPTFSL